MSGGGHGIIAEEARIEADWQAVLGVGRVRALRRALWELALSADPHLHPPEAPQREERKGGHNR
jgi:hypothetical protein